MALLTALDSPPRQKANVKLALLAVAGVTALDVIGAILGFLTPALLGREGEIHGVAHHATPEPGFLLSGKRRHAGAYFAQTECADERALLWSE